jgi:hypothetical protein
MNATEASRAYKTDARNRLNWALGGGPIRSSAQALLRGRRRPRAEERSRPLAPVSGGRVGKLQTIVPANGDARASIRTITRAEARL